MTSTMFAWLGLTLLCIICQAYYSMMEMASVSFNKVRLHYYVSKGNRSARWLNHLLQKPSRLFGTTLMGVNIALQIGSECSRQMYAAFDLSPNLAPITQVLLVLIAAELAPMFAARKYAEHVVMLGISGIYLSSKLFTPALWCVGLIASAANKLIGSKNASETSFLSRDDLQRVFESPEDSDQVDENDFNMIVSNIFSLRQKQVKQVMTPIESVIMVPSNSTVDHMRSIISVTHSSHIPIYHRSYSNIVGLAFSRTLVRAPSNHRARDYSIPPWFVTQKTKITSILQQFRRNNQSVAIVLDNNGLAVGILTLDDVLEEVFGQEKPDFQSSGKKAPKALRFVERSFPGNMPIVDFNEQFDAKLNGEEGETLSQLLIKHLGHAPVNGESIKLDVFEFTVEEATLLGIRTISVKTIL